MFVGNVFICPCTCISSIGQIIKSAYIAVCVSVSGSVNEHVYSPKAEKIQLKDRQKDRDHICKIEDYKNGQKSNTSTNIQLQQLLKIDKIVSHNNSTTLKNVNNIYF